MLATSPVAWAIATAPTDDPERTLLLSGPKQGGWQAGVFFEGRWLDFATLTMELSRCARGGQRMRGVIPSFDLT